MRYVMDSSFLTGVESIDTQHAQLFQAINTFLEACEKGKAGDELLRSLNFLSDYTVKHFFDEEQILKKYGFSDLAKHNTYHEAFKKVVRGYAHETMLHGASADLIRSVEDRIGAWLVEHIKGQDFRWAKELKQKNPELFTNTRVPDTSPRPDSGSAPSPAKPVSGQSASVKRPAPAARPVSAPPPAKPVSAGKAEHSGKGAGIITKVTVFFGVSLFVAVAVMAALGFVVAGPDRPRWPLFAAGAILLLLVPACRFALELLFSRPLRKIAAVMENVERGDVGQRIRLPPGGEIGTIAGQFDCILESLRSLVMIIQNEAEAVDDTGIDLSRTVTRTVESMNGISDDIRGIQEQIREQAESVSATNRTAAGIAENTGLLNSEIDVQTESVAHSSSAIEEMLASIETVTAISRTNSENVARLAEASEAGRMSLQAVADDIREIARESEGLMQINSVLQNISSQTNLLAMNAAIEAAHAGEAGKGFAVVSDEIRKLAEESSGQSKTISSVLKKISDSITKISGAAGGALGKFSTMETDVKTVADQEERIRDAMEEQSAGSRTILESVGRLTEITRTVKARSGEMRTASGEIISQGKSLEKITSGISGGMAHIAGRLGEVNDAVMHVREVAGKSGGNISILKDAISRFVVKDRRHHWDDSLSIGIKKIDDQHRQLFDAINSLMDALERGRGAAELKKALDFLVNYTATHFADEEEIQKACGYPDFENHRRIHEAFKKTALLLVREFESGMNPDLLAKEARRKFGDWLVTHIKGQDFRIRDHIRQSGYVIKN